jgi:hypothetical protein
VSFLDRRRRPARTVVARVAPDNRYTLHDADGWLATARDVDAALVFASAFEMLDLLRRISEYGAWAYKGDVDALLVRIALKEFPLLGHSEVDFDKERSG